MGGASIRIGLVVSAVVAVLGMTGCRPSSPEEPIRFRYHLDALPRTLDPAEALDIYSYGVVDRLFDGVMRLDRVRNVPVPDLAESVQVSSDGLTYTFRLLPGARFHNGRPIVAADFEASWKRILEPGSNSPSRRLFEMVAGVEDFAAGRTRSVSGIEAVEPHLLRVRLRERYVPFLYQLADPGASVVPIEEVERRGAAFAREPVGSGSFKYHSRPSDRLVLEAFREHPRHPPAVDYLIYEVIPDPEEALRRYQQGELDLVTSLPPGSLPILQQSFSSDLRLFPGWNWFGVCFRCDRPPFDDPRVRSAMSAALDRSALVRELDEVRHTPTVGFLPQGIPGHDPADLSHGFDLERAEKLLADAGHPHGRGLPALSYTSWPVDMVTEFLVRSLAEVGLVVQPRILELSAALHASEAGQAPFFFFFWTGEYPDPDPFLRPLFHSQGYSNYMAYSDPEVDAWLDAARSEGDEDLRRDLYRKVNERVRDDAPCIALYQRTQAVLLRPQWRHVVLGYEPTYLEIELFEPPENGGS